MTPFDDAQSAFRQSPNTETARAYLRQANASHKKSYIGDATLLGVKRECAAHVAAPPARDSKRPRSASAPFKPFGKKPASSQFTPRASQKRKTF